MPTNGNANDQREQKLEVQMNFGHIKGYLRPDGYYWIQQFTVLPEYRGRGYGHMLAKLLPQKCKLFAYPMMNGAGPHITPEALVRFYEGIGFRKITEDPIMVRE